MNEHVLQLDQRRGPGARGWSTVHAVVSDDAQFLGANLWRQGQRAQDSPVAGEGH
jgi:hypothetical protein